MPSGAPQYQVDVYSCVTGGPLPSDIDLKDYLARQVVSSVDFVGMARAIEQQCDMLIEVGPNEVLTKLASDTLAASALPCLPTASSPNSDCEMNVVLARSFISGVDVKWERLFERRITRPFVPPEDRIFIDNPCERPIADVGEVEQFLLATAEQLAATSGNGTAASVEKCYNPGAFAAPTGEH